MHWGNIHLMRIVAAAEAIQARPQLRRTAAAPRKKGACDPETADICVSEVAETAEKHTVGRG